MEWEEIVNTNDNILSTIWTRSFAADEIMKFLTYNATASIGIPDETTMHIAPMQAFWVRVKPDYADVSDLTINLNNVMRSHKGLNYGNLRAPRANNQQVVRISLTNGVYSDQTVLVFNERALDNFDDFDSEKMSNELAHLPEIYTKIDNIQLAINGMSKVPMETEIPLGFRTGKQNDFAISVTELRNMENLDVILKDNIVESEFNLTNGENYMFSSDVVNNADRFSIIFRKSGDVNNTTDYENGNIVIFTNGNDIIIKTSDKSLNGNAVNVFNIIGQKSAETTITGETTIIKSVPMGTYIVKAGNKAQRVIIK